VSITGSVNIGVSAKFIKLSKKTINADMIVFAERTSEGSVVVHFAVPKATAVGTEHWSETFLGVDANALWDQLNRR
jgi:hypothetical protein